MRVVGLKVVEVLRPTLLLCEIPNTKAIDVTVNHNSRTHQFTLNPNFAPTFADLKYLGYEYVPVDVSEDTDGIIDSVCIGKVPAKMAVLDFLSQYSSKFQRGLEELWWIVKGDVIYLFGWWD